LAWRDSLGLNCLRWFGLGKIHQAVIMAERSFAQEVGKLRIGDGEEFRGEGILAVTKALLQSGVGYVGGYQGAPISHLMDVLSDAQGVLGELGVHFEASAPA
jgi:indolepyruvate ferredoxin oxidoreductase alpha subunit